jgi:2-keto-4-pentenoate hydratase/2-oxohepta-3-ene-1,7-dioic acid hydratase in catechol pathway
MTNTSKRGFLQSGALMATGAVVGCATPGTPENVGPVVKGDVIECHIDGLPELSVKIV